MKVWQDAAIQYSSLLSFGPIRGEIYERPHRGGLHLCDRIGQEGDQLGQNAGLNDQLNFVGSTIRQAADGPNGVGENVDVWMIQEHGEGS